MKKLLLILILSPLFTQAQFSKSEEAKYIQVGKVKSLMTEIADLKYKVTGSDTTYVLNYSDLAYKVLDVNKSVSFKGGIDAVYNAMLQALEADKGKEESYNLGNVKLTLKTDQMMGKKYVRIFTTDEAGITGYFQLVKKQINTLFGK